jgi:hypothetical protein
MTMQDHMSVFEESVVAVKRKQVEEVAAAKTHFDDLKQRLHKQVNET